MNLVITGNVGAGKTTWCREYAQRLIQRGIQAGGIVCPATFERGVKTGYNVMDLSGGQCAVLGSLGTTATFPGEKVGKYLLSDSGLAFARHAIEAAIETGCDVVFLDEIGHLELAGKGLAESATAAYRSAANTVSVVRKTLLSDFLQRFSPTAVDGGFIIREMG